MSFSEDWNKTYQNSNHLSVWPWSDLVSYVKRYTKIIEGAKVLELGCGAGANIPFFLNEKADYYAIEGSQNIIEKLIIKYPNLNNKLSISDFTKEIPFNFEFDLIVDRGSITHNKTKDIKNTINLIHKKLKNTGFFIGIDWFSTQHSEFKNGDITDDIYTKTNYSEGTFSSLGNVHFSDKEHLEELFTQFKIIIMEHKILAKFIPSTDYQHASWNFIAQKI